MLSTNLGYNNFLFYFISHCLDSTGISIPDLTPYGRPVLYRFAHFYFGLFTPLYAPVANMKAIVYFSESPTPSTTSPAFTMAGRRGILGVKRDPKKQLLFSFQTREGEEWPSDDSDSDYQPDPGESSEQSLKTTRQVYTQAPTYYVLFQFSI